MKIRNGFVSNSSSSSFVLIVEKEKATKVLDDMEEANQGVKDKILKESISFKSFLVFHGVDNDYNNERAYSYEEWGSFLKGIGKSSHDCFLYNSIDC